MMSWSSPNFDSREGTPVSLVVLHYTGMATAEDALRRLVDPAPVAGAFPGPWQAADIDPATPLARVSSHWVVEENGRLHELVPEQHRAWHAGRGSWRGAENVNARSVGIEIANGGHDFGLPPYPEAQIVAVMGLVRDILSRHGLDGRAVIAHSDLAPGRKADPGEHFPWARLAQAGLAVHPAVPPTPRLPLASVGSQGALVARLRWKLAQIGYGVGEGDVFDEELSVVVRAVQRRIRPALIDGALDLETSALIDDFLERVGTFRS
jgi:N-acetylmuramoyl-L-alanine amidase